MAAEINQNLEEIRQKNLLGKGEIIAKPPSAFKKPPFTKVFILFHLSFYYSCLFSQLVLIKLMNDFVQLMIKRLLQLKKKKK